MCALVTEGSDVCSSDLVEPGDAPALAGERHREMYRAGRFARAALFIGEDDVMRGGHRRLARHGRCDFPVGAAWQPHGVAFAPPISEGRRACKSSVISPRFTVPFRSEEHTSELQSLLRISYARFCLQKKTKQ